MTTTDTTPPTPQVSAAASAAITTTAEQIATDFETITGAVAKVTTATAWTAIVGFFTALPGIIALIQNFMSWLNAISGNNPQALISDFGKAFAQLSNAKTPQEKTDAAQNISSVISRLPS